MRTLIGLLVAICLIPTTAALGVTSTGPEAPLLPGQAWAGQATLEIPCRSILETGTETTATVALTYTVPEHISFDGPAEIELEKTRCLPNQAQLTETVNFALSGSKDILALHGQAIDIEAKLVGSGQEGSTQIMVLMEYVGGFEASAPILLKKAGPQKQISYQIELQNVANGPTRIYFEVESRLNGDTRSQVLLPDMVLLGQAGENDLAVATVVYSTPFENGSNYVEEAFSIKVMGEYAMDPARKTNNTEVIEFGAITEGMYVPGPGLILAPGLLVLAAFLRRRA